MIVCSVIPANAVAVCFNGRSPGAHALVEFWQGVYENLAEFDVPLPVRPFILPESAIF